MKNHNSCLIVLFFSVLFLFACKNAEQKPAPSEPTAPAAPALPTPDPANPATWIGYSATNGLTFMGEKKELDALPGLLDAKLSELTTGVPKNIDVNFEGEVLMGTRGDIKTTIQEAIDKAKFNVVQKSANPEQLLQNFYAWYFEQANKETGYNLIDDNIAMQGVVCKSLRDYLTKENKKEGGLGLDYFFQAQDFGLDWGKVTVLDNKSDAKKSVLKIRLGDPTSQDKTLDPTNLTVTVEKGEQTGWCISKIVPTK